MVKKGLFPHLPKHALKRKMGPARHERPSRDTGSPSFWNDPRTPVYEVAPILGDPREGDPLAQPSGGDPSCSQGRLGNVCEAASPFSSFQNDGARSTMGGLEAAQKGNMMEMSAERGQEPLGSLTGAPSALRRPQKPLAAVVSGLAPHGGRHRPS